MSTQLANNFCSACGSELIATAIICPKCGSPTSKFVVQGSASVKSKTSAVLLAVFLGIWSWLYTYKVNRTKFWVTLAAYLALCLVILMRVSYFQYQQQHGYYYLDDAETLIWRTVAYVWLFTPVGFWIWAIVDNSTKPNSW